MTGLPGHRDIRSKNRRREAAGISTYTRLQIAVMSDLPI